MTEKLCAGSTHRESPGRLCSTQQLGDIPDRRCGDRPGGFDDEPEAEIGRRDARGAAAGPGIADEVGHVGAMGSLHDTDAAIGVGDPLASAEAGRPTRLR